MKLKSSFILLKREINNNIEVKIINGISLPKNIHDYIKDNFPDKVTEFSKGEFLKQSYRLNKTSDSIDYVKIMVQSVVNVYYLDIIVAGNIESELISVLEEVQNKLFNSGIDKRYITIISYDAISEYYCNRIFPKLNTMERNLRKLLLNVYTMNFEKNYYEVTIRKDLQKKLKEITQAKGGEKKRKEERIKNIFYSLELGHLDTLFFSSELTLVEENAKQRFLSEHDDLSKLTDAEIRRAFDDYKPKSDWDRFFSSKIQIDDIKTKLDNIREFRNSIAHQKIFNKQDYIECNKLLDEFTKAILEAIEITEEIDFAEKNNEHLEAAYANLAKVVEPLERLGRKFEQCIKKFSVIHNYQHLIDTPAMRAIADFANTVRCETIQNTVNSPAITAAQSLSNFSTLQSTRDFFNASQLGYNYLANLPDLSYLNVYKTPLAAEQATELINSLNSSYSPLYMDSAIGLENNNFSKTKNDTTPEIKDSE